MSVDIEPLELHFRRPLAREVTQILKIRNSNPNPVAFKIRTTAPKRYCVRPNAGIVEPGSQVEVQVILQAMRPEPPPEARCKDKFLVQSIAIMADLEFSNIAALWQQVDGDKTAIQEKKIRVAFLHAENHLSLSTPARRTVVRFASKSPCELKGNSDPPQYDSLATPDTVAPGYSSPGDESHIMNEAALAEQPSLPTAISKKESKHDMQAQIPVTETARPTYEELEARLREAEVTIAHLKNEGRFRQRKAHSGEEKEEAVATRQLAAKQRQGNEGVPLNIVAALCLATFFLGYIFF